MELRTDIEIDECRWMYYHFDEVDAGPHMIREILWTQVILVLAGYSVTVCL